MKLTPSLVSQVKPAGDSSSMEPAQGFVTRHFVLKDFETTTTTSTTTESNVCLQAVLL